MKTFTNKSVAQKILITLMIFVTLSCSIPKPVQAAGGILLSPFVALASTLLDGVQYLLESTMLGESSGIMKFSGNQDLYQKADTTGYTVTVKESDLDGTLWGWDSVDVPVINYTPEEIFSNRVPALDVNFISPSVKTGDTSADEKMNVAIKLQPVISSWYTAIRILAIVGLLSVLVYLGIRMILSGIAADKAKYKKMFIDWLVAMCLIFALHYIMSLILTGAEVITSMISSGDGGSVNVVVVDNAGNESYSFSGNLMSYVRFMMQQRDTWTGIAFLALYLMLIIYNVRFTWTYLKRVVNMAFLTLIAPIVCLTYPIDKVSDGKAQAFDMWLKEYIFNALIQPVHLLLYIVLLGSATELAVNNPLYAVVALGFIFTGEGLLKKMFGFGKASGGTVGSLAGAAGVSALANQALMRLGKGPGGKGGPGGGKVRTNDQTKREGKNTGANKGYASFDKEDNKGIEELAGGKENETEEVAPPSNDDEKLSIDEQLAQERQNMTAQDYRESGMSPEEWEEQRRAEIEEERKNETEDSSSDDPVQPVGSEQVQEALGDLGSEETWESLAEKDRIEREQRKLEQSQARQEKWNSFKNSFTPEGRKELKRKAGVSAYKTIRGIRAAAPTAAYKAARGALSLGSRALAAGVIGATAGVIGATTGDGEKAISMALGGAGVGWTTGKNAFEGTAGRVMRDKSVRDSYGAGKYGSAIDARNERADKEYLKSAEHAEEFEKYFKGKMSKADFNKATKAYRESGITDKKEIRNALKLEEQYLKNGGDPKDVRGKVQNIVQTYSSVDKKAIYGDEKATAAALRNIESQLSNVKDAKQRRAVANEILQGYRDWYNAG